MTKIKNLNDAFRKGERPELGRIVITSGIRELVAAWPLGPAAIYAIVQNYDKFTNANDPHSEHDFGSFEFAGIKCYWKIDTYDLNYQYGSEHPDEPTKSRRVPCIMRADEY